MIAGGKGSGKTTAGGMVPHAIDMPLAQPLKAFAGQLGFHYAHLYGPSQRREEPLDTHARTMLSLRFAQRLPEFARKVARWSGVPEADVIRALRVWFEALPTRLTARHFLKTLGTDCGRALHEDVWIRALRERITTTSRTVVVSDARFDNEFIEARAQGWDLWHIERPLAATARDKHASEQDVHGPRLVGLRTAHYVNDGTLADLQAWVRAQL